MSKPTIRVNAGIYDLVWLPEQVAIRIDRVRENHEHVTGEVTVKSLMPGVPSHLHQARLNLTSTVSRRTLAKVLEERNPEAIWEDIVEQTCVEVLQIYRQGEPVVEIHEVKPREGPRYRLAPLLLEGHPNYCYGEGSAGKSYLAAFFAVLVSSGAHRCGLDPIPGNVLYLDYEMSGEEMQERILAIEEGLGEADCSRIQYRYCVQPFANEIETIQAIVAEQEIELVIIDSAGPALGGEKGDPKDPVIEYFRALRSLRCSSLTLDHVTKDRDSRKSPYGSVYKFNLARNLFELRSQQEPGEDSIQMGLYHRKANFGKLIPPMGLTATFTPPATIFTTCSVRDIPALAEGMGIKERMKTSLMEAGTLSVNQIAEELDKPADTIRKILNRYRGKVFTQVAERPEGLWAVLQKEQ